MAPGTPLPLREGATPSRTYMYPHSALCASVINLWFHLGAYTSQLYNCTTGLWIPIKNSLKIPCLYIINKLLLHVYREGYIEIITYNYILKILLIRIQRTDRLPLYHSSNISPPDALLNFLLLIKVYIPGKTNFTCFSLTYMCPKTRQRTVMVPELVEIGLVVRSGNWWKSSNDP